MQPAPEQGEEGGGEPAGQVQSLSWHGRRPLRAHAQDIQE